jgi:hypothetical protein
MSEAAPLLMQIHDQFDVFDRYPYTDHSMISNIKISTRPQGYRVTTYPGGTGYGFDGLAIDLDTSEGMFSGDTPVRVETGRDYGPLMVLRVENVDETEDGALVTSGTIDIPVKREGLSLPGDPGFELFTELHDRIKTLKSPLREAIEVTGIKLDPTSFGFRESTGSTSFDHEQKKVTHHRTTAYDVAEDSMSVRIQLDATIRTNLGEEPSSVTAYRSGSLKQDGARFDLSMDALLTFSGLHSTVSKLYR